MPARKTKNKGVGSDNVLIYRIIDANINRSKEGMRVCEEVLRFYNNNKPMTKKLNCLKHRLTAITSETKLNKKELLLARDSKNDIGQCFSFGPRRKDISAIFWANSQRTKESLRVLEEFFKLSDVEASKRIQKLRFDYYGFEKELVQQYPNLFTQGS